MLVKMPLLQVHDWVYESLQTINSVHGLLVENQRFLSTKLFSDNSQFLISIYSYHINSSFSNTVCY